MSGDPILSVDGLTTEFMTEAGQITAVRDVGFDLEPGERLGIVGESGSGKSVTALSIMGLLERNGRIAAGSIEFDGRELTQLDDAAMNDVRGDRIAMIMQDPMTALTPTLTVGTQVVETLLEHRDMTKAEARTEAVDLLDQVRVPDPESVMDAYPDELSGGQRQRVLVAIAISCSPDVLIADEPTTALDVTIQAQILDLLDDLVETRDMALVHITHDLGVIAEMTDRVAVMYAGQFVEIGATEEVFVDPRHPYTAGLLRSTPRKTDVQPEIMEGTVPSPFERGGRCEFAPRCPHAEPACREQAVPPKPTDDGRRVACVRTDELGYLDPLPSADEAIPDVSMATDGENPIMETRGIRKEFSPAESLLDRVLPGGEPPVRAVDGIDISLGPRETLGLVGESGSGKTTLGRLMIALTEPTAGEVRFDGEPLHETPEGELRSRVQFVFQDPNSSLNPRQTVGEILGHAVEKHGTHGQSRAARIESLLEEVGLEADLRDSYPFELSGGQRQRVGLARALSVDPDVLIADEPTSALDVSVQGQILSLLQEIKRDRDLAIVFISHDLSVIRHISDRIAVMYLGEIVETGRTDAVFEDPAHPYTEALLSAIPRLDPRETEQRVVLSGEVPDPKHPPEGCNFNTRCPKVMDECFASDPELADVERDDQRQAACLLHHEKTK
ncbi:MAG: dipeptide ABC transporter ATP-binding protein [Halobacteriales archaeon]